MLILSRTRQAGDTLIEVLFAITVFSLVSVGCLSIMNQGSATAERALEITLVRAQINNQAETLRFLNTSFIQAYIPGAPLSTYAKTTPAGQWAAMDTSIEAHPLLQAQAFDSVNDVCPTPQPESFIFDTENVVFQDPYDVADPGVIKPSQAVSYSQLVYTTSGSTHTLTAAQGIWVQAVRSATDPDHPNIGYIDFHIDACWQGPGQSVPVTLGTIVRLYEPRG
jgi:type II secretory pathway pseudopilin PulG